jgi:hypothetical protein
MRKNRFVKIGEIRVSPSAFIVFTCVNLWLELFR